MVYYNIAMEGLAETAAYLISINELDKWSEFLAGPQNLSSNCKSGLNEMGLGNYSCVVILQNDESPDKALAAFEDGEIIYNIANDY